MPNGIDTVDLAGRHSYIIRVFSVFRAFRDSKPTPHNTTSYITLSAYSVPSATSVIQNRPAYSASSAHSAIQKQTTQNLTVGEVPNRSSSCSAFFQIAPEQHITPTPIYHAAGAVSQPHLLHYIIRVFRVFRAFRDSETKPRLQCLPRLPRFRTNPRLQYLPHLPKFRDKPAHSAIQKQLPETPPKILL